MKPGRTAQVNSSPPKATISAAPREANIASARATVKSD